jgi:hypothetical protein
VLPLVSALLALGIMFPLLRSGFVLNYDMVFAPQQDLLPESLGLSSALPRSVPADAVVALATRVVPGDIVQKIVLFLALFAGPLGAGRLVPTDRTWTRVIAAVSYGWSAYVAERLFIGHWPLLLAYACLPWVLRSGLALRRGESKALPKLILACAPAVLSPPGGVMVAVAAMAAAGWRRIWVTTALAVTLNAPWWTPALFRAGATLSDPAAVSVFSSRAETGATAVTSVLGLGGIWNAEAMPASRSSPVVAVLTIVVVVAALFGVRVLAASWGAAPTRAVLMLGAAGVLVAAMATVPVGATVMRLMVTYLPGAGMLRDAQKWVMWWAPVLAIGFALAVEQLAARLVSRTAPAATAILLTAAVLPVAMLPDLAFGGLGRLAAVRYPDDWTAVRTILAEDERPGDVVALPLSTFRRFAWNANRTQLDPAPRVLPRSTVTDDTLIVGDIAIRGEDPRPAKVRDAMRGDRDLGRLGIGWVLVEHGTPGNPQAELLATLQPVYSGPWLSLYHVGGPVESAEESINTPHWRRLLVLIADILALSVIGVGLLWAGLPIGKLGRHNRMCPATGLVATRSGRKNS